MRGEKIIHRGIQIEIQQDEDAESPRNWDNFGVFVAFHKRYYLGDVAEDKTFHGGCVKRTGHGYKSSDFNSWTELAKQIERDHKPVVILPVYLYDHSGLRVKVGSFQGHLPGGHAEWDSGQIGFIFASREAVLKEHSTKRITKKIIEQVVKVLQGEVETYDQYLRGDVYGYIVGGDDGDSCWGFFGYDYCLEEAKRVADHYADKAEATVKAENALGNGI